MSQARLLKTPLHGLHVALGAKMVEFAGYDMPVQFADGVLKEHLWTRERAGLFDVSHMGQAFLRSTRFPLGSDAAHDDVAAALETLVPGEIRKLKRGGMRLSVLLNERGGVQDDLMITRPLSENAQGRLYLVVNAACKDADLALLRERLAGRVEVEPCDAANDFAGARSLVALQGPKAAAALERLLPGVSRQTFMTMTSADWRGAYLIVSRCGYTGEDGFEISIRDEYAEDFVRALLENEDVRPIGLGARDSLRLEAGLCLYGHDLDGETSPVEGALSFVVGKRRREEGGFPGADRVLRELREGPSKLRVGLRPEGRAPAREGVEIRSPDGRLIGAVTSGGFGPSVNAPVAMGYVETPFAGSGTEVHLMVRGKALPARVADLPFHPHRYFKG